MQIAFLLILVSGSAFGAPYNLRELCRERVAGIYLTLYDEVASTGPRLQLLKERNQTLQREKKTQGEILTKTKELLKSKPTDIPLRDQIEILESKLAAFADIINENQKSISKNAGELKAKKLALKNLQASLPPVFEIVKISGKDPKGYPFKIEYATPCRRFHEGCALSSAGKQQFKVIFKNQEMPEACQKYVNISEAPGQTE